MRQSPLEIIGPLGIRRFELAKTCEEHVGHQHNYDHTTIVMSGRIRVSRNDGAADQEVNPSEAIYIPATVRHTVKALAPHTVYLCVFSHRDFDGMVVQRYEGNNDAYGHDRQIEATPPVLLQA